ncbi:glycosyltransferase family 4 protein [Paeniglutamicibacter antarcticus]|uniref:D-inositol 3-phosphate glycosyltransferase n=1 Tax=Arthrobacter terrae TaxID=2935737 RepID=A0A931CQJ6_9MICC|nr:glycosyltransferase family 4 protein [Arthrobacter terrae]MBG0739171.1 glycosyltransferase family 4 protein [Arthrobacter terrae]
MKVLLLAHSYWPEHSPPQRRWSAFIRNFRDAGWDVDVVTPVAHFPVGRRELPRSEAGVPFRSQSGRFGERVMRVPFIPHGNSQLARLIDQCFSAAMSIPASLLRNRPDVVVATAPSLPILAAGFIVSRIRRVPLIVEMRDAWPDLARDARMVQGSVKSVVEHAVEFIQNRAELVVTVTEGFAATLRSRGVRNVATVSNGLDVDKIPVLPAPDLAKETFTALYLGNHGASQRLDVIIRASALVGHSMHLTLVGHGTQRKELVKLARELDAPVTFLPSLHGPKVLEQYAKADTCVVSLRDDWKSFETTVPSKTYEVLAIGRHVTAVVLGEAERIVRDSGAGDVVKASPEAIAALWRTLAADRGNLIRSEGSRQWVKEHADYTQLSGRYMELISELSGRSADAF